MIENGEEKSQTGERTMSGKKKIAGPDLPRACEFCENAAHLSDEENVLCAKHGVVNKAYCCSKFVYDPLKRVPRAMPPLPKLNEEDLMF